MALGGFHEDIADIMNVNERMGRLLEKIVDTVYDEELDYESMIEKIQLLLSRGGYA